MRMPYLDSLVDPLDYTAFAFEEVVKSEAADFEPRARAKGLTFTYTRGEDVPPVWGDRDQLKQVVRGLLTNAFRAAIRFVSLKIRLTSICILPVAVPRTAHIKFAETA